MKDALWSSSVRAVRTASSRPPLHLEIIMDREFVFRVTQEDIDNGKPCNACLCPVALAIERAIGDTLPVYFDEEAGRQDRTWVRRGDVYVNTERYVYPDNPTAHKIESFIDRFDSGMIVSPISGSIMNEEYRNRLKGATARV